MKKLLPILLIVLALQGNAQNYIPLVDNSSLWLVRHGNGEAAPTFYYYGFNGEDTLINNLTYRKLFRSEDMTFASHEYYAALREDINTRQVLMNAGTAERVLYDFSLNSGDSIDHTNGNDFYNGCTVHSTVSNFIGGAYRKNIFIQLNSIQWLSGSWAEGIGNIGSGGLMFPTTLQPTCDCSEKLVCFKNNGSWKYHNPEYSDIDCADPLGTATGVVQTTSSGANGLILYPNPVKDLSTLRFNNNSDIAKVGIYDLTGRLIASYKPLNRIVQISKGELAPACYYYCAHDKFGNQLTGKFIVE